MVFEFVHGIGTMDILIVAIVFLLFVMVIKRIIGVVTNVILISVAAILIPVMLNRFTGLAIATDVTSLMMYISGCVGLYFLYLIIKKAYPSAKKVAKVGGKILPKNRPERVRIIKERVIEKPAPAAEQPKIANKSAANRSRKQSFYKNYVEIKEKPALQAKRENFAEKLPEIKPKKSAAK